ncbi:hypothetical protein L2E82_12082 [Cichorium intybus]|uniref:Uncharacterized protein n=1 Tax=Cichorium intybus TaxID=13427 RepID=A0ACB9GG46_CICIN|nr:hypothetical protein L2E82_12082 [Cichorium intybus]
MAGKRVSARECGSVAMEKGMGLQLFHEIPRIPGHISFSFDCVLRNGCWVCDSISDFLARRVIGELDESVPHDYPVQLLDVKGQEWHECKSGNEVVVAGEDFEDEIQISGENCILGS